MADFYGSTTLPLAAALAPVSPTVDASDPLLSHLLSYLQAVANARLGTAWAALAPGSSPVVTVAANDPADNTFNERGLPALFAWRPQEPEHIQLALDWRICNSLVSLLWVAPPVPQERSAQRAPFANRLFKLFDVALTRGRDPSWTVSASILSLTGAGSSPAGAALAGADATLTPPGSAGTVLWALARNLLRIEMTSYRKAPLRVTMADGSPVRNYEGWEATIQVRERLVTDASGYDDLAGISITERTAAGTYGDRGIVTDEARFSA